MYPRRCKSRDQMAASTVMVAICFAFAFCFIFLSHSVQAFPMPYEEQLIKVDYCDRLVSSHVMPKMDRKNLRMLCQLQNVVEDYIHFQGILDGSIRADDVLSKRLIGLATERSQQFDEKLPMASILIKKPTVTDQHNPVKLEKFTRNRKSGSIDQSSSIDLIDLVPNNDEEINIIGDDMRSMINPEELVVLERQIRNRGTEQLVMPRFGKRRSAGLRFG